REFADLDDRTLSRLLMDRGINSDTASRLVVFLSMAYCRSLLTPLGAKFSEYFRAALSDGTLSSPRLLTDEPLWVQATNYARSEVESGINGRDILLVAGRSAEFDAANQLLKRGSALEDVLFDISTIHWPS